MVEMDYPLDVEMFQQITYTKPLNLDNCHSSSLKTLLDLKNKKITKKLSRTQKINNTKRLRVQEHQTGVEPKWTNNYQCSTDIVSID